MVEKGLFSRHVTISAVECEKRLFAGDYSALRECPFVLGGMDDIDGRIGRDVLKRAGIDNPIVTATSHNVGMLLRLSLCGVGACVCPQIIVRNMLTHQQTDSLWIFQLGEDAVSRIQFGCQTQSYQWSVIEQFIACAKRIA